MLRNWDLACCFHEHLYCFLKKYLLVTCREIHFDERNEIKAIKNWCLKNHDFVILLLRYFYICTLNICISILYLYIIQMQFKC